MMKPVSADSSNPIYFQFWYEGWYMVYDLGHAHIYSPCLDGFDPFAARQSWSCRNKNANNDITIFQMKPIVWQKNTR